MKNYDTFRIVGACAFGALIGSLVSLEIAARFTYGPYLWIIGALVGGCIAYVTIDFSHFCYGVSQSFRRTIAWRPNGHYWRAVGSVLVASVALVPTVVCSYIILFEQLGRIMPEFLHVVVCIVLGTLAIVTFSLPASSITLGIGELWRLKNESIISTNQLNGIIEWNWKTTCTYNPVSAAIFVARHTLRALSYSVVHAPVAANVTGLAARKVCKTIWLFVVRVFVYVHSTRRTICFVDAAIGAVIGYCSGSAIIGSVAGAILGVINYEVVSVRWLRLAPASRCL